MERIVEALLPGGGGRAKNADGERTAAGDEGVGAGEDA
jgi:hypothetical protein